MFPWATESATRPPSPATADLVPFSPAWLESVLYQRTAPDAKARAKAALLRGEALAAEGEHLDAIAAFESVYATAPTEYKMCQRAGLDIAKSYKSLSSKPGDAFDRRAEGRQGRRLVVGAGDEVARVVHHRVPIREERVVHREGR